MKSIVRTTLPVFACAAAGAASAHSGHGIGALATGLAHLFTPEHLLPVVAALGLLSAAALAAAVLWRTSAGSPRTALRIGRWVAGTACVGVLAAVLALPGLI